MQSPKEKIVPHHPYYPDAGIVGNVVAKRGPHITIDLHKVFDGKDDQNFVGKTLKLTKYTSATAFVTAAADIILLDRMGIANALRRGIFWGVPLIGGGFAYCAMVCFASSIRKKDGELNHFFGGQAAGAVVGAGAKCFTTGLLTGLFLGVLGASYKNCAENGYELFPDFGNPERNSPFVHKLDFTNFKEYPANWVRGPKNE